MEQNKNTAYEALKLENQLCFPLYACSKEIIHTYRKPLERIGLTYTQYVVMMVLWEHGTMSEKELGEKVYLDSGTLSPLLKRLEKQELIIRERPETNERMLMISLTEKGLTLKDEALVIPFEIRNCIDLPDEDLIQLKKLLEKVLDRTTADQAA